MQGRGDRPQPETRIPDHAEDEGVDESDESTISELNCMLRPVWQKTLDCDLKSACQMNVFHARIYTMRPGTGQRIYLGETHTTTESHDSAEYNSGTTSKSNQFPEVTEFDVTHLLPVWALVVRPVHEAGARGGGGGSNSQIPAAYIHYDGYTGRPHLVGRWPGRVMLGLVATLDDSQPLASTYVDIGGRGQNENRGSSEDGVIMEETVSVVAIRAECVVSEYNVFSSLVGQIPSRIIHPILSD
ncbi:unnamed protein product [Echinostoma caproni]|uniref:DUF3444 domain-containing protein n=1 Tax=Echinostoma caproni TaxID=27848 RepID=A0A183AVT1_9TREM|nr:unnamed protein product [Echinostoma caproni]